MVHMDAPYPTTATLPTAKFAVVAIPLFAPNAVLLII
jgi:hypothetical protein